MQVGGSDEEDALNASINTTPLVDVMLVLLIIFLITIPVVTHTIPVQLPSEKNQPVQTKPQDILISVTRDGDVYWGTEHMTDNEALVNRLKKIAVLVPQPELHVRGDQEAHYQAVGRVVFDAERAGIQKIGFITQPENLK